MPNGVHNNHTRNGGGKPSCTCNNCRVCRHRINAQRWRQKRGLGRFRQVPTVEIKEEISDEVLEQPVEIKEKISDEVLEQRLVDKFKEKGWD